MDAKLVAFQCSEEWKDELPRIRGGQYAEPGGPDWQPHGFAKRFTTDGAPVRPGVPVHPASAPSKGPGLQAASVMAPSKLVARGLVAVSAAAILVVMVNAHPAVPLSALAASSLHGAQGATSTSFYDNVRGGFSSYSYSYGSTCSYSCGRGGTSEPSSSGHVSSSGSDGGPIGPAVTTGFPSGLVGGPVAALLLLLLLWLLTSRRRKVRRDVRWVREHLRAVADSAPESPTANTRRRPGGMSLSIAFEPHPLGDWI
jgi:hypothetical protein